MGKKSKKSIKTLDLQVPVAYEDSAGQADVINLAKSKKRKKTLNSEISDNNFADSILNKKKKHKHPSDDLTAKTSVQIASEETLQAVDDKLDQSTALKGKKKKKKHHSINEEDSLNITAVDNSNVEINVESIIHKKTKKNKSNLSIEGETNSEIDQIHEETVEIETRHLKKKKNKTLQNEDSAIEQKTSEKPSEANVAVKEKVTKSQKKKKTGTAVLNAEESQVTEEDIDKFCDELDEEDNKQYEEWVKLIEASLLPRPKNK